MIRAVEVAHLLTLASEHRTGPVSEVVVAGPESARVTFRSGNGTNFALSSDPDELLEAAAMFTEAATFMRERRNDPK